MKIILLGAPGAGKGTQAEKISERYAIPQISTGNIIREALQSGSRLGKKTKSFMDAGQLVPDDIVIKIVRERIKKKDCKNGFILDGFPRTLPQAEALDKLLKKDLDAVLEIKVDENILVERLSGRRVCPDCGATYHIVGKKPMVEGKCDKCSGTLIQRKDDTAETIKERLSVYHEQTEPLIAYYRNKGKLISIESQNGVEETAALVLKALEDLK